MSAGASLTEASMEGQTLLHPDLPHGPTDQTAASLEVQPHHLFQMQDKHKTTAAMNRKKKSTWK